MSAGTLATTLRTLAELEQAICDAYRLDGWPDHVERARHVGRREAFEEAARILAAPPGQQPPLSPSPFPSRGVADEHQHR